jgi:predicted nucleic acid-binding protein
MLDPDEPKGVTLYLQNMSMTANKDRNMFFISATVRGETPSEDYAKEVEKRLNEGVRIYMTKDFQASLIQAMKKENVELARKAAELERAYKAMQEKANKMGQALQALNVPLGFFEPER